MLIIRSNDKISLHWHGLKIFVKNKKNKLFMNKKRKQGKLKLATLFSGVGAVEHALSRMKIDHDIVFACDTDEFAKKSYFANYNIDEDRWFYDIKDLDGKKFKGKVDLLMGGSPCQSFSMVGKRKGMGDERGLLVYEFIRVVKEAQPKVFIFENVKGLLNHNGGRTWNHILEKFDLLGYSYYFKVLNARDFGVPQNRERVFLIGFKKKRKFEFPEPAELRIAMQDLLEDNPDSKYYLGKKGVDFVTKTKNLEKKYTQINGKIALCQKANQQFNWHGDFILSGPKKIEDKYYLSDKVRKYVMASGTGKFYSKPQTDLLVARPLLSTMAKMHRAGVDNYVTKGSLIRKLTPRECFRLMGFSDNFKIVVSDTQAYKQAGNSVVVDVIMNVLGKADIYKYAED